MTTLAETKCRLFSREKSDNEYVIDGNKISPKSGELENHHIIDILDKCLSIVKKLYVKKVRKPKYHKEWSE